MHTLPLTAIIVASLLACTTSAIGQGGPQWGTQTVAVISDVNFGGGENNSSVDIDGEAGAFFTFSEVNDLRGVGESFAALQIMTNQTPILKSRSALTGGQTMLPNVVGAHAFTGAFASDIFQYTGAIAGTLQLTFTLDGLVSDLPGDAQTFIAARVAVFNIANYEFSSSFDTLVFELGAVPKASDLTTLQILDDTGGAMAVRTATLTFNVTPGETFYVWETLDTSARRDTRFADAFNTLSAEFDHPELVVAVNNVPEPGCLLLLLCGVAALGRGWRCSGETAARR